MDKILKQVKTLAKKHHTGQLYGDMDYFNTHIEAVVVETELVLKKVRLVLPIDHYNIMSVAYLHDIVEDTTMTLIGLLETGVPPCVVRSVEIISKKKNESRKEYLERVITDEYATIVKLADATANMKQNRKEGNHKRAEYYEDTICFMYKHLCDLNLIQGEVC